MELIVDIGNTCVKYGLCENEKIIKFFRYLVNEDVNYSFLRKEKIDKVIIASVSSIGKEFILNQIRKNIDAKIIDLDNYHKNIKLESNIKEKIEDVGIDLIADLYAAKKIYKTPAVIFDIGTVTKALILSKDAVFLGAALLPSIEISLKSLNKNTDLLPLTKFHMPNNTYGDNTDNCICSGVYYTAVFTIKGYIKDFKKKFGVNTQFIFTGGGAFKLKSFFKSHIFDDNLTLLGIYYIYKELFHEF